MAKAKSANKRRKKPTAKKRPGARKGGKRTHYEDAFKRKAVSKVVVDGKKAADVAKEMSIHPAMLSQWKKKFGPELAGKAPRPRAGKASRQASIEGLVLYDKQQKKLRNALGAFRKKGATQVDESMLIRFAINQTDLSKMPEPI